MLENYSDWRQSFEKTVGVRTLRADKHQNNWPLSPRAARAVLGPIQGSASKLAHREVGAITANYFMAITSIRATFEYVRGQFSLIPQQRVIFYDHESMTIGQI